MTQVIIFMKDKKLAIDKSALNEIKANHQPFVLNGNVIFPKKIMCWNGIETISRHAEKEIVDFPATGFNSPMRFKLNRSKAYRYSEHAYLIYENGEAELLYIKYTAYQCFSLRDFLM